MEKSLLDELGWKKYIGMETETQTGEVVLERDIRRYAMAIDDPLERHRVLQKLASRYADDIGITDGADLDRGLKLLKHTSFVCTLLRANNRIGLNVVRL